MLKDIEDLITKARSPAGLHAEVSSLLLSEIRGLGTHINIYDSVRRFYEHFGLSYRGPPRELSLKVWKFRHNFLQEEVDEYRRACKEHDKEKMLDALIDIVVVAVGTMYLHGFKLDEGFRLVMESQMTKVRATPSDGRDVHESKELIKPEGWKPPNLKDLV